MAILVLAFRTIVCSELIDVAVSKFSIGFRHRFNGTVAMSNTTTTTFLWNHVKNRNAIIMQLFERLSIFFVSINVRGQLWLHVYSFVNNVFFTFYFFLPVLFCHVVIAFFAPFLVFLWIGIMFLHVHCTKYRTDNPFFAWIQRVKDERRCLPEAS